MHLTHILLLNITGPKETCIYTRTALSLKNEFLIVEALQIPQSQEALLSHKRKEPQEMCIIALSKPSSCLYVSVSVLELTATASSF
jgi:hypothetical protein